MRQLTCLFMLVLIMVLRSSACAFDLDSLLRISAGGEEAMTTLNSLASREVYGRARLDGQEATFVEYFAAPDRQYTELIFPGFSIIQASDGKTVWRTDMNGRASQIEGYTREQVLADIFMSSFAYLLADSLDKIAQYNGVVQKEDTAYHEVAFFPYDADTVLAYLDTATGLIMMTVSRFDNRTSVSHASDYHSISGLLFPFHARSESSEGSKIEIFVDSINLNTPVDTTIFALPDIKMCDFRFPGGVNEVTLPVKYIDGHIWIPVTFSGHKRVWMVLDTGASTHMLNRWAIDELKLPEVGKMAAVGIAGEEQAALVRTDSIQIGGLTLYNQICGSMNLSAFTSPVNDGSEFGGLLGQDFWSRFPILVDYARSKLTVFNPDSFKVPEGGIEVPFYLTMLIPTIKCEVNGISGDFLVDIGNSSGLILNKPFIEKNQLDKKLSMSLYTRRAFGGIGGFVTGRNGYTGIFKMGDVQMKSLLCFVPDTAVGLLGSEIIAGNIGNRVLDNYRILLDYGANRIIYYTYY